MTSLHYDAKAGRPFLCKFLQKAEGGCHELRIFKESEEHLPPSERIWITDPGDEVATVERRVARGEHVYISVAAAPANKGGKQNLLYTDFVHADMDFKDYAGGEQEARERLKAYDKQPAMVVHSGAGLQTYFEIKRHPLNTEEDRTLLERALKQLCIDLGADNAATDCSRILRLPGTFNFKAKYGEPRPVVLEYQDSQAPVYPLDAFPMLAEPQKRTSASKPRAYSTSGMAPDDAEVLRVGGNSAIGGKFRRLLSGDNSDFNGDHSAADQSLCHYLAYLAGPGGHAQVERLWRSSNLWRDKGDECHSADGRSYAQMTVDTAYEGRTQYHDWNRGKSNQKGSPIFETASNPSTPEEEEATPEEDTDSQSTAEESERDAAPDVVAEACAFVAALWEQLAEDPGLAYSPDALKHLGLLYSIPAEWARIKPLLRKHKLAAKDLERAFKQAQEGKAEEQRTAQANTSPETPEERPLRRVGDVLIDPPLKYLLIPGGYQMHEAGIQNADQETVAYSPVLIIRRLCDIDEKTESLCLAWKRSHGWKSIIVPRSVALNAQQIIPLADLGFPVSSDNARALVGWLHDFEAVNFPLLPKQDVASHLGWQGANSEQGFLWGNEYITPEGERLDTSQSEHAPLKFHVSDPGAEQMAEAFHAQGTFEGWQKAVNGLDKYAAVQMALYAALIPPLLPILNAANLIVDWANRTSTGKTTALRVAASVWGCADDRMPNSLINSWDATRVWVERASCMLNGLPLILDDTKRAKRPEQVAQTLYDVANGRGKGRGSLKGTQRITRWRTVLLSTGEAPATASDDHRNGKH